VIDFTIFRLQGASCVLYGNTLYWKFSKTFTVEEVRKLRGRQP